MARPKKTAAVTETPATTVVKESQEAPPQMELSPEELNAIMELRAAKAASLDNSTPGTPSVAISDLAQALIQAINATKPPEKKTSFNRKRQGAFDTKDGSPKPRLKRVMYQHGVEMDPTTLLPEEILLLNQIKPGVYCEGVVRVIRRKDRSYDIDYPVRTSSQRLKVNNIVGAVGLKALLNRLIQEASDPSRFKGPDDGYDD